MPHYMLILRDDPDDFRALSPEEMQRVIERYRAWSARLLAAGKVVGSNKLADEGGKLVRGERGRILVKDGPFAETKEIVSGYWILRAKDYAEALELVRDHPHLASSGSIEVREVDLLGAPET
mgnify:CR=1 FL=1